MDMENRERRRQVRFVEVPDEGGIELCGVRLPKFGVFLDEDGEVIPIVLDDMDRFRVMTRGMLFTKQEAMSALKEPLIHGMTSNADRRRLHREIQCTGLARHKRGPLERALADFDRPMWGICSSYHLHIYLRGEILRPVDRDDAACSIIGASLLLARLMAHGFFTPEDTERLLADLGSDPRFEGLPLTDPPPMFVRVTIVRVVRNP